MPPLPRRSAGARLVIEKTTFRDQSLGATQMEGPADRPEQGRDAEHAHPDTLDRIDGLQNQVATAETEAETARTAAREGCPGGGDAAEGGGEGRVASARVLAPLRGVWRRER